jgi:DNA repair exonuclease SbcCD ATPase subunit
MDLEYIEIQHEKIEKIYHIADVHIRNVTRHEEYREVFEKFYKAVKRKGTKNSLIVVAGDIAHSKVETSPELVREMTDLFVNCANLTDTIVIPGNHDCNLNNTKRLDVISPVVDALNNKHVHYLRENGLYKCKNILFSHFGIFEDVEKYITFDKIPKSFRDKVDTTIALWHGPMNAAKTDIGYEVSNKMVTIRKFDGFDMALLGDIHKYQTLQKFDGENDLPAIVYPGSLVQQNHGENLDKHGYCVWDVKKREHKHFNLKNDYGYFTVDIKEGKIETDLKKIPKKARLRIRCYNSEQKDVKSAVSDIGELSDLEEVSYIRGEKIKDIKRGEVSDVQLSKLNDVTFQNDLIKDFLNAKYPKLHKKIVDGVFEINKDVNSKLSAEDKSPCIQWIPKKFEFSNMFSYGEDNTIDFTKLEGINGIFAGNASGKSSLMSALCFCIWDKCERTFKASEVMNESKMSFHAKFNFELNGVDYYIERSAKRDKKGKVSVNVDFWRMIDGERENLNDESRRSTNEIIRSFLGEYDDFVLTTLSLQKDNSNFTEKSQTERKDLIARFLGITVFDRLNQIASDESKEINGVIKKFNKDEIESDIEEYDSLIECAEEKYSKMVEVKNSIVDDKESLMEDIIRQNSMIVRLEDVDENIDKIESQLKNNKNLLDSIDIDSLKEECIKFKRDNEIIESQIEAHIQNNIEYKCEEFNSKIDNLKEVNSKIDVLKVNIRNKIEKVKFLDTHEYDEDCEFCMKNAFVQDAIKAKEELQTLKPDADLLVSQREEINQYLEDNENIPHTFNEYKKLKEILTLNESEFHKCYNNVKQKENDIVTLKNKIENLEDKKKKYYDSIEIVKVNEKIKKNIIELDSQVKELSSKIELATNKIMETNSNITLWKNERKKCKSEIREFEELESQFESYRLYLECVNRDGVPYDIIRKSVPSIEAEANNILSQIVEFNVSIDTDGKNVNGNIVYDERTWALELTSGKEGFISNLALRIALTNISNMPKTNFLCLDEGLGTLDADAMASMPALFSFLKDQFDFVLMITHIDSAKDLADSLIEIKKTEGFSSINNI